MRMMMYEYARIDYNCILFLTKYFFFHLDSWYKNILQTGNSLQPLSWSWKTYDGLLFN